ncbi:unnamed protein product [Vitrella brassicaformis CCMP3155]|uniref:ShKT domain-containing protein n=1 Tax=Vitrella brassicaformis (strain CCMP3155) TaxID=1169540 RepID=A0A0G4FFI0_VITBC|nr:unnamed protein product [Vitrella brassicaformis CCMP3155]|eukprot:CEM11621.1 unnamed protein product [Vitrella brassicaformis CCMP3155]
MRLLTLFSLVYCSVAALYVVKRTGNLKHYHLSSRARHPQAQHRIHVKTRQPGRHENPNLPPLHQPHPAEAYKQPNLPPLAAPPNVARHTYILHGHQSAPPPPASTPPPAPVPVHVVHEQPIKPHVVHAVPQPAAVVVAPPPAPVPVQHPPPVVAFRRQPLMVPRKGKPAYGYIYGGEGGTEGHCSLADIRMMGGGGRGMIEEAQECFKTGMRPCQSKKGISQSCLGCFADYLACAQRTSFDHCQHLKDKSQACSSECAECMSRSWCDRTLRSCIGGSMWPCLMWPW